MEEDELQPLLSFPRLLAAGGRTTMASSSSTGITAVWSSPWPVLSLDLSLCCVCRGTATTMRHVSLPTTDSLFPAWPYPRATLLALKPLPRGCQRNGQIGVLAASVVPTTSSCTSVLAASRSSCSPHNIPASYLKAANSWSRRCYRCSLRAWMELTRGSRRRE